jgi:hydroxymethylbilane synthase
VKIRLGTRGSRLALAQAHLVSDLLRAARPGVEVEISEIRTSGDRIQDVVLGPNLGQSFFTKEIESALLAGDVDIAVHSCKDLATVQPTGLCLGAILEREDPRDVLVSADGSAFADLPPGATVGTASVRRRAFLAQSRPDLRYEPLRGNVPTRLRAVEEGRFDAVVLAAAGLERLNLAHHITERMDPAVLLPAAAQGAIAIQVREADADIRELVQTIDHPSSRVRVEAERACLNALEAGCQAPVGALASLHSDRLEIRAAVLLEGRAASTSASGPPAGAEALGREAAETLLKQLGVSSLRELGLGRADPEGP